MSGSILIKHADFPALYILAVAHAPAAHIAVPPTDAVLLTVCQIRHGKEKFSFQILYILDLLHNM